MNQKHAGAALARLLQGRRGNPARDSSTRATCSTAILLAGCAGAALLALSGCTATSPNSTTGGSKPKFDESLVAPRAPAPPAIARADPLPPLSSAGSAPEAAVPPPAAPAPAPQGKSVRVASAPAESATAGKTLFEFKADNQDLKAALAAFARANNLNIVPDNDVTGTVTLDVRNLPLEQMMRALLDASDCSWQEEGGLIRVRSVETRSFTVDYLRLTRKGKGQNSATLSSSTSGGSGGGGGGSSGGGGGGGAGGGGGGGSGGSGSPGSSSVDLTADNQIDFWKELKEELGLLLTPAGKNTLAMSLTAGIIQVTDRPSALTRIEHYLHSVDQSVHRQVDIDTKIYDVTLSDQFQFGIDWVHVAEAYGGSLGYGASTLPIGTGGGNIAQSALGGLNSNPGLGGAGLNTIVFQNFNTKAAVNALQLQGNVEVISQPRIRTLNNQTAMIKVGTEQPFFNQTFQNSQSSGGNVTTTGDEITTITVGTILSITPQITDGDWVSMDISPVLTSLQSTETSPSGNSTAPVLDTKQASTIIRVHSGDTVVLGGLIETQKAKAQKKVPLLGDIPGLGWLFTGTFHRNTKRELVLFVTPHVIKDGMEPSIPAVRTISITPAP